MVCLTAGVSSNAERSGEEFFHTVEALTHVQQESGEQCPIESRFGQLPSKTEVECFTDVALDGGAEVIAHQAGTCKLILDSSAARAVSRSESFSRPASTAKS